MTYYQNGHKVHDPIIPGETWLDRMMSALRVATKVTVTLFGQEVECALSGYGAQVNGYYVEFQTRSPEGYHTKFAVFDDDIKKVLDGTVVRMFDLVRRCPGWGVTFYARKSGVEYLTKVFNGRLDGHEIMDNLTVSGDDSITDVDGNEMRLCTIIMADLIDSPLEMIEYLETCWEVRNVDN